MSGRETAATLSGNVQARLGAFSLRTGDFSWPLDGITALFGRSGCGKAPCCASSPG
jgi:hypothetical protein